MRKGLREKRGRPTIDDVQICNGCRTVWVFVQEVHAIVGAFTDAGIEGNFSQQLYTCFFGEPVCTAGSWLEYLTGGLAVGTDEARHVLDKAEDGEADLAAKVNFLVYVLQGDLLGGGDEDGTVDARVLEVLYDGEVLIGSAGRGVDDEIV